jgi:hypothetical protein
MKPFAEQRFFLKRPQMSHQGGFRGKRNFFTETTRLKLFDYK